MTNTFGDRLRLPLANRVGVQPVGLGYLLEPHASEEVYSDVAHILTRDPLSSFYQDRLYDSLVPVRSISG